MFTVGDEVVLTAVPERPDAVLDGWSDGCVAAGSTCALSVDKPVTIRAAFSIPQRTRTLRVETTGTGTVTSTPQGLSCSGGAGNCEARFAEGATVTLEADAAEGWLFDEWGGACPPAGPCRVTLAEDEDVTATFVQASVLTVKRQGSGDGSITLDTDPFKCGAVCRVTVRRGTSVRVQATPALGSRFAGWSDSSCGGSPTCSLKVDGPTTLVATFVRLATLTVARMGAGSGSVRAKEGIDCPPTCTVTVDQGSTVVLEATPAPGSAFVSWSVAGCTDIQKPCQVEVAGNLTVEARFEPLERLTVRLLGNTPGTISSPDVTLVCATTTVCTAEVVRGTTITLYARVRKGVVFTGWPKTPGCSSRVVPGALPLPSCSVTLARTRTVYAEFALEGRLRLNVIDGSLGDVVDAYDRTCTSQCTFPFRRGSTVTLTARPRPTAGFTWGGACKGVTSKTCTVTIALVTLVSIDFYEVE
jgi:hypothetical protein